jgi:hypothetical protein
MEEIKKGADEELSQKMDINEVRIAELSHVNEGETGFNPTAAEMAEVFEGIKAGIRSRGKKKDRKRDA